MRKKLLTRMCLTLLFASSASSYATGVFNAGDFDGVRPEPIGKVEEGPTQLHIRFPVQMKKADAFSVTCSPAVDGAAGWADNNELWTYDFKAAKEWQQPRLKGGTKCEIVQSADLTGVDGKVWKAGTLNYSVSVAGPNVTSIHPANGFDGDLREKDPVILITFDGPIDKQKFFANQSAYLSYTSGNAPGEKLEIVSIPADALSEIFAFMQSGGYLYGNTIQDNTWVLTTVKRNLVPGAELMMTVQNVVSATNADIASDKVVTKKLYVRGPFKANIECGENQDRVLGPTDPKTCLPQVPISIKLNGHAKWNEISQSYIEYVPYGSKDKKTVRSYPQLKKDDDTSWIDMIGDHIPFLKKYSDTIVDSVTFDVAIEPETAANVHILPNLTDLDGRALANEVKDVRLRIGSMEEMIVMPQANAIFEREHLGQLSLPVAIVNLNQKLAIRKTGKDAKVWTPVRDIPTIIRLMRQYEERGGSRETVEYTSPLASLGVASTRQEMVLTGKKNHGTFLQFPFGIGGNGKLGGVYPIEISSPTYEAANSDFGDKRIMNPAFTIAQLTDLAVAVKTGDKQSTVWVTSLSQGKPVGGATVDIYNCNAQFVKTAVADASGLVTLDNQKWATGCGNAQTQTIYGSPDAFFVVARAQDDFTIAHSSWQYYGHGPSSAPGVEYVYSSLAENQPFYHAVIGVNLVKPGQKVPVEILAKWPTARGLEEVPAKQRAKRARIVYGNDQKIYQDFDLKWSGSAANFEWQVPAGDQAKLGQYSIQLFSTTGESLYVQSGGDIEVAEFKIPLMSGLLSFPATELVRPDAIPVNSLVRYANGTGASNLPAELAYYFAPVEAMFKNFPGYNFGNGTADMARRQRVGDSQGEGQSQNGGLPSDSHPEIIAGLSTAKDGVLVRDLAKEKLASGLTVAEALKTSTGPQRMVVRLRYQDQSGEFQTLSQAKNVYNADHYVGTMLVTGQEKPVLKVAVVGVNGKIFVGGSRPEMKMFRIESRVIGEELFGGLIKSTVERTLLPVDWSGGSACAGGSGQQQGVVSCPVGSLAQGTYAFQATTADNGQAANVVFKVDADGKVYADGDYSYFGDQDNLKQLTLTLDKPKYKNGDTAVVSFASPFKSCSALVTLERSDVIKSFVVDNACERGKIEVPVDGSYAPNAFISVYAIIGRQSDGLTKVNLGDVDLGRPTYRLGYANLKVDWSKFNALVEVTTDKAKYEPGPGKDKSVNVTVAVKPEEGTLKNGKVTLVAIEKNILKLKPNTSYSVLDAMMQMRDDTVQTITDLDHVESITAKASADKILAAAGARKGGMEGGDGSSSSEQRRKLFDALVAFKTDIPVVNGQATASFDLNDSLTNFVVFAIVSSDSQKFGMGQTEYLSEKATQAVANTPNVGYTGDSFPAMVSLQNNSGQDQTYRVELTATFKGPGGALLKTLSLSKRETLAKGNGKAVNVGQMAIPEDATQVRYQIRVYDSNGKLVDSLEPDPETVLPAIPLAIHDSFIKQVDNSGSLNQPLDKDPSALPDKGEIRVTVSSSLVTGALAQLNKRLEQDPYADFFVEERIFKALLKGSATDSQGLKTALNGLQPFMDGQGFIKYYTKAERGSVWLTAAIINILGTEKWAVDSVPASIRDQWKLAVQSVLNKSIDPLYLENSPMSWMRAQTEMGAAAYSLGDADLQGQAKGLIAQFDQQLAANPGVFGQLVDKWSNGALLDYWTLQALASPQAALTSSIYKRLTSSARLNYQGNLATLIGKPSTWFVNLYSDETVESAQLLAQISRLKVNKELARALAIGLISSSQNAWYVARSEVWTGQSLKLFGTAYEKVSVNGVTTLALPSENQKTDVTWTQGMTSGGLTAAWTKGSESLQVTHSGKGNPWVGVQALTAIPLAGPVSQGLTVDKTIRNLNRQGGAFKAGDLIEVTLQINAAAPANQIAMRDPIPSGANIVGEATGYFDQGEKSYQGYKLYFDSLPQGLTTIRYTYQLNNVGTFKLPPTRAEGLYTPSIYGETPNTPVIVDPQQ